MVLFYGVYFVFSRFYFTHQAFGVGAFEDDDDDIYAVDSMENYDVTMGKEKKQDSDYGWTRPQQAIQGFFIIIFVCKILLEVVLFTIVVFNLVVSILLNAQNTFF